MHIRKFASPIAWASMGLLGLHASTAQALTFSSASATYEQMEFSGPWSAELAKDGLVPPPGTIPSGWAVYNGGVTDSATALFTLASPLAAGSYLLTYTLTQSFGDFHLLDTFSLAYTTAASPTLASAQTLVNILSAASAGGATMSMPSAGNIDVSGTLPAADVYTIVASITAASPITGLYLNAIDNAGAGPGRQANGNFVLTEFAVNAAPVPEPSQWALLAAGLGVVGHLVRKRKPAQ